MLGQSCLSKTGKIASIPSIPRCVKGAEAHFRYPIRVAAWSILYPMEQPWCGIPVFSLGQTENAIEGDARVRQIVPPSVGGGYAQHGNGAPVLGEVGSVPSGVMGAVAFGAGDFAGGRASRHLNGLSAVAVAQLVAAATAVLVLGMTGGVVPAGSQFSLAVLAGTFHVIAVFHIYQGMALGRVCVVAPVAGVVGIAIPVLADVVFIEMAGLVQCAGILLATASIVLMSHASTDEEDRAPTRFSIRCGIISGMGYGFADLCLGLMTTATAEGGLAVARLTGASLSIGLLCVYWLGATSTASASIYASTLPNSQRGQRASTMLLSPGNSQRINLPRFDAGVRIGLLLSALAGFLDCIGQLGYVLSATQGRMSVAAALVAMYPAVSVALAIWLLKERIAPMQFAGIVFSLSSIALLSQ